jgi:hypothetical protein
MLKCCDHCGSTRHWFLDSAACPYYDTLDGAPTLNMSRLLSLRPLTVRHILTSCLLYGCFRNTPDDHLQAFNLRYLNLRERARRKRHHLRVNSTTANATSTLSPTIITPPTVIQTINSPCHTTTDSPPTDPPSFDSSPGFSYLCNDSPSSNHWLYGTHPDDPPTPYLNALTLAHAAHRDPDHQYLHHYDHAIASSAYMPTYTPTTSPSFSIPSTLERYLGASIAARGNDVLTFIPVSVYANTNTEQTHTYAQLDNGSSINLIDSSFATRHNFTTRACKSVQVHGIGGVTTMTHEALVVLYLYGTPIPTDTTANISNSLAYKAVVIPFAINPTTMTIPLLIGSHVLSWLSTTPTNITGVAADSATILHHPNWLYRLQIPNLTSNAIRQIRHHTWSYDHMIDYITTPLRHHQPATITSPLPSPTPQPPVSSNSDTTTSSFIDSSTHRPYGSNSFHLASN